MASSRSSKKEDPTPPRFSFHIPGEVQGILLLACSLMLALSLLSFAYGHPSQNWVGLMGYTFGWLLHMAFGIASYGICLFFGWMSFRLLMSKPIAGGRLKMVYFSIGLLSLCMLLSVLEEQFSTLSLYIQKIFYPYRPPFTFYHLGGNPVFFLYRDLPLVNLKHILNPLGVSIVFSSTLLASGLFFSQRSITDLFRKIKEALKRKDPPPGLTPSPAPQPEKGDFMKYVKLRLSGHEETFDEGFGSLEPVEIIDSQEPFHRPPPPPPRKMLPKAEPPASKRELALKAQKVYNGDFTNYKLPPLSLLTTPKKGDQSTLKKDLKRQAEILEETLLSFGIEAKVGQINCGPTITSFEVHPAIGVKVQKIKTLENDIALNMQAKSIRIMAPIPGKAAVGIEVPNPFPQEVGFKDMMAAYQQGSQNLRIPLLLGKAVNGDLVMSDLAKMPHCIIAGATGSGKSVCINTIIMSILYTARPDEIQLVMVDPKKVELTPYSQLPHMIAPVITEPFEAYGALQWMVKEMESRYELLKQLGVRNIEAFNQRKIDPDFEATLRIEVPKKLPYIVGIIDELADLMMASNADIETPIARIAQMARAVGIHLILATQRPSREVITGLIKANFPTRISFKVASRINSQIILDEVGAEALLGNGDMLFLPPGFSHLIRAQGAYIRDEDIQAVIQFIQEQAPPRYRMASFESLNPENASSSSSAGEGSANGDHLYQQALEVVTSTGNASTTFLQRKLKIGYARAASLMDALEENGIVSSAEGSKARRVLFGKGGSFEDDNL